MPKLHTLILSDSTVIAALRQAWFDSVPGVTGGHEEGGFIIREDDGSLLVKRWKRGAKYSIDVPPHHNCQFENCEIVATFHTHPNTGGDYLQEPSETDIRAVRNDQNLKGANYVGEFIISTETIFLVTSAGQVREFADTDCLFENE
jgi:hypothetical protein